MPSVTVVGSVNLDLVASTARLPLPGETVSATDFSRHPGGKGANQALAAQLAGSRVRLVAAVGRDELATEALSLLSQSGVDLSRVIETDTSTGIAMITVDAEGENQIVVVPGANGELAPSHLDISKDEIVLCQLEVPLDTVAAAAAATEGIFCLNPSPVGELPDEVLESVDLLIVNESERDVLGDAIHGLNALVVVTLGAAGAKAFRVGRLVAEAQPPPVVAIDTVGAGDAFCGALVTALATEKSIGTSLEWACAAGALATTRRGAQPSFATAREIDLAAGL